MGAALPTALESAVHCSEPSVAGINQNAASFCDLHSTSKTQPHRCFTIVIQLWNSKCLWLCNPEPGTSLVSISSHFIFFLHCFGLVWQGFEWTPLGFGPCILFIYVFYILIFTACSLCFFWFFLLEIQGEKCETAEDAKFPWEDTKLFPLLFFHLWAHPVAIFHGVYLPRNCHHWPSIILFQRFSTDSVRREVPGTWISGFERNWMLNFKLVLVKLSSNWKRN